MRLLITGGAGFIGSAVCRQLVGSRGISVVNLDKLTYAANLRSLDPIANDFRYALSRDVCDRSA
jgi:dTDP-glucose 4,6-dehydratase